MFTFSFSPPPPGSQGNQGQWPGSVASAYTAIGSPNLPLADWETAGFSHSELPTLTLWP